MSVQDHDEALERANAAVRNLYQAPEQETGLAAATGQAGPAADDGLADDALQASEEVTEKTVPLLEDKNPAVREVAAARLAALAARDFAIAYDLARLDDEHELGLAAVGEPSALSVIHADVGFVLTGDPADGLPSSGDDAGYELAGTDEDPRAALRAAAPRAESSISDDAITIAFAALRGIATETIAAGADALLKGIVDQLPHQARHWYQKALRFAIEGIIKLSAVFGEGFVAAVGRLKQWLTTDIRDRFANAVFGLDDLRSELETAVDGAADDRPFARLGDDVQNIVGRFATQKKVLLAVFKAIGFAGKWLVNLVLPGYGTVVVDALYVLGAGYGIFVAGDYMDWHRTKDDGVFDFVVGVRRTLENGLA